MARIWHLLSKVKKKTYCEDNRARKLRNEKSSTKRPDLCLQLCFSISHTALNLSTNPSVRLRWDPPCSGTPFTLHAMVGWGVPLAEHLTNTLEPIMLSWLWGSDVHSGGSAETRSARSAVGLMSVVIRKRSSHWRGVELWNTCNKVETPACHGAADTSKHWKSNLVWEYMPIIQKKVEHLAFYGIFLDVSDNTAHYWNAQFISEFF